MDRILRGGCAALLACVVASLAACATYPGTAYPGGAYPDNSYPGNAYPGNTYPGNTYPGSGYPGGSGYDTQVVGAVQGIDVNSGRLMLSAEGSGYGYGGQVEVFFDNNTQLYYQGQQQSVAGLEPGDRIRVDAVRSSNRLWARTIEVLQDVRAGGGYGSGYGGGAYGGSGAYGGTGAYGGSGAYGNELHGAVAGIDSRARLIRLTTGGYAGAAQSVYYDGNTRVEYQGQVFRPEQLEAGDVVRIQARQWNGAWLAERVWVEVDARSR